MSLFRRAAALVAMVTAARNYVRQNPEKVNRYADRAATFVNQRTQGRYQSAVDSAVRQIRKETAVPGRPGPAGPPPNPTTPNERARSNTFYPSTRADR